MNRLLAGTVLLLLSCTLLRAQGPGVDETLWRGILGTGMVHAPLPLEKDRSLEKERAEVGILSELPLEGEWRIAFPNFTGRRAVGPEGDRDYATYGGHSVWVDLGGRNLEGYDRIAFDVLAQCDGVPVVNINVGFENADKGPLPGYNNPSGSHFIHLRNFRRNSCFLEIEEFRRDAVRGLSFSVTNRGMSLREGDSSRFVISNIRLQRTSEPSPVLGWAPQGIVYSTAGYDAHSAKKAVVPCTSGEYLLRDSASGDVVYSGRVEASPSTIGQWGVVDFSSFTREGTYLLEVGDLRSEPFPVRSLSLWSSAEWRVLNFIFCQRCGYPVDGIHPLCHEDLFCDRNGLSFPYAGGWHDAGDLSQQTLQSGEVAFELLEAALSLRDRDPVLGARLSEEARWGYDFVLRCRLGDGYHASSMGLLHFLDGVVGSFDDIHSVRKQNHSFDNFIYSAWEAYAAMNMDCDEVYRERLSVAAKEDFRWGWESYSQYGIEPFEHMMEHTYNTSPSQYMATLSWAASQLYSLTGERSYAEIAASSIRYVLSCQRREPLGDGTRGFFYRDESRRSIVHFIHQAREHTFMQALTLLCSTQREHPDYGMWKEAIELYGQYLKGLMKYTYPYGMIPSGVYNDSEWEDGETFRVLHIMSGPDAPERYRREFALGERIDEHHAVKRFPIWFGIFNGNNAVLLSQGKAAALCGHFLQDEELLQIGREQLYWVAGKNPFGQSLIYGEGYRYPSMNSFSIGEVTGEMPVGIRTLGDGDEPYFPHTNNACYKEVWVTVAGRFLSLVSEY